MLIWLFCLLQPVLNLRDLGLSELKIGQIDELVESLLPGFSKDKSVSSHWRTSHVSAQSFFENKYGMSVVILERIGDAYTILAFAMGHFFFEVFFLKLIIFLTAIMLYLQKNCKVQRIFLYSFASHSIDIRACSYYVSFITTELHVQSMNIFSVVLCGIEPLTSLRPGKHSPCCTELYL